MRTRFSVFFGLAVFFAGSEVLAQECESVIALSKVQSVTISDEATVKQQAQNFCNEYSSTKKSGGSISASASYKFLSGSFGSSSSSAEDIASRYCSASNSGEASSDAYRQYVESISPNAFAAYERCKEMSQQSVRYNVDLASVLPTEFTMSVYYGVDSASAKQGEFAFSAASGVACAWDSTDEKSVKLASGSTEMLKCSRSDYSKRAYVMVARKDGPSQPMTLPWPAYTDEGIPVITVSEIQLALTAVSQEADRLKAQVVTLQQELNARSVENANAVRARKMTFVRSSENCPEGARRLGTLGVLMHTSDYANNVGQGGHYGGDWRWTHPILCSFD